MHIQVVFDIFTFVKNQIGKNVYLWTEVIGFGLVGIFKFKLIFFALLFWFEAFQRLFQVFVRCYTLNHVTEHFDNAP